MGNGTDDCRMHGENNPASEIPATSLRPQDRLNTLQRNALRKLFGRPDFSPDEVAALGYRRLQQAEGIGEKGMRLILSWLNDYGYELKSEKTGGYKSFSDKQQRLLEKAMRILNANGFEVSPRGEASQSRGKR